MDGTRWIDSLPTIEGFAALDAAAFRGVPADWRVVVADVVGSTAAIAAGRAKDVNTLGAACIVAAQNAAHRQDIPSAFGGDGATLLSAPDTHDAVEGALHGVAHLARTRFGLRMRVGAVPVAQLLAGGHTLSAARYRLVGGPVLWAFEGTGIAAAEAQVKGRPPSDEDQQVANASLDGLSCRWDEIPSRNGSIVAVIIVPARGHAELAALLRSIDRIVGGDSARACPVDPDRMHYRTLGAMMRDELRYARQRASVRMVRRLGEVCLAWIVFRLGIPVVPTSHYRASLPGHSDFRKFDGSLRMVLDLTDAQRTALGAFLRSEADAGRIRFGMHSSQTALMTCLFRGLADGKHVHLIDGGSGGYTLAAAQMKSAHATAGTGV